MKIGIDVRLWSETGVGRYIRNLVEQLLILDKHNEYCLFALSREIENIKDQISKIKMTNKNVKIIEANFRWHSIEEQLRFPKVLNKENLDLVHFPYFSVPIFYNRPFVATIHDLILNNYPTGQASTLPLPVYWLKHFGYRYIISQAAKKSKKIIVPSNATKDEVIKHLKIAEKKIVVTPEGAEGFATNSKIKTQSSKLQLKNQNYFLYVGNAYPHKNLDRALHAFKIINSQLSTLNFILVGKEDYFYNHLKQKVRRLDLEENVIFLHNINDAELSYLYKHAICLITPSLMEGFGLTLLEAMATNCLVVASEIPAFREVVKDGALFFNPTDINDMKEKMLQAYLMDKKEKEQLMSLGKIRSKEFSWTSMASQTLKVYESSSSTDSG